MLYQCNIVQAIRSGEWYTRHSVFGAETLACVEGPVIYIDKRKPNRAWLWKYFHRKFETDVRICCWETKCVNKHVAL